MDLMQKLIEAQQYSEVIRSVFVQDYKNLFDEHELTSKQTLVLDVLEKRKLLNMHEIAEIICATPSAASQFVAKLEKKNYVKREINPNNRREILVTADIKAQQFFQQLEQLEKELFEKYYMQLPERDILDYHRVLKKLAEIVTRSTAQNPHIDSRDGQ
ncbi:MarR family winged helix-turn-helix transcriptional regulator [Peribacillus sp. SCS-155]|uniref:MarR family winged helix-turn-helix transcriptional regulator n=1 Tax=Peribacillus sedimenti TaxID=3115297 RepID=UPI0039066A0F